eukprot:jgi/Mesvir1/29076/Mv18382-RA.1
MGDRCKICVAIVAKTVDDVAAQIRQAADAGADLVEIRLDHIAGFDAAADLPVLLSSKVRCLPAIVTYRPDWEGGQYKGPEEPRFVALRLAMALGADYVDIELKAAETFLAKRPGQSSTRIIVSSHNYASTPSEDDLADILQRMAAVGADIAKIATTAQDVTDALRMLQLPSRFPLPVIALAMGPRGQISRLLAPKFGGYLTFASMGAGQESAPGQSSVHDLVNVYGLRRVTTDTKIFGLIGNPVSQSKGPLLHNASFMQKGVDALYVPFLVDDCALFLQAFRGQDFAGFSVTIPHKQAALACVSVVDPLAKDAGVVNTLIRRPDGTLYGTNTDMIAAVNAVEKGLWQHGAEGNGVSGKRILVYGAGGAGRGIAFGLKARGGNVVIASRRDEAAKELASTVGCDWAPAAAVAVGRPDFVADVFVNASPVGMVPNVHESPVPKSALAGYSVVFDAVYNPMYTQLLKDAQEMGATAVTGVDMFVGQAAEQFRLFTGLEAPVDLMEKVVVDSLTAK